MKFSVFQLSRRGGRPTNEDRMGYCYTREAGLFVLADGMGGHAEGEVASQLALQTLAAEFQRQATPRLPDVQAFLQQGVMLAHERILAYGRHKRMSDGPRTTVVAAVIQDGYVSWVNCGDSRLYWARDGVLQARTRDHSYAEMDRAGALKLAHKILNRNVLYTCLGAEARPVLDFAGPHKLQQNDRLLLCSDGLWDVLQEHILLQRLSNSPVQDAVPALVDAALQTEISKSVAGLPYSLSLGGSAGNTIRAMARLGCDVGFIGKVGTDKTGDFFIQALENLGIEPFIFRGKERSGRCVSLISPDGERTMVTFLGAALELSAAEVTPAIFEGYDCLYIEGYLVQDHELIAGAVRTAKACGLKVAIDLASFNVVEANLEFLRSLIQDYVDIVFANEDEAKAFTGEGEPLNALQMLSELCELAVVKVGIKGALIKRGSEVVHVGIMAAAKRVDTTGAGDLYAAGFLSGLCEGLTLRQCGTIGAIVAGKVIEVVGTTFSEEAWQHAFQLVEKVRSEKYLF